MGKEGIIIFLPGDGGRRGRLLVCEYWLLLLRATFFSGAMRIFTIHFLKHGIPDFVTGAWTVVVAHNIGAGQFDEFTEKVQQSFCCG